METAESLHKPLLRGVSHQHAFFAAAAAGAVLVAAAPAARSALAIYALCLAGLFGISALYHRRDWGPVARGWMRRLDHSAIYLLIAGTYTPVCRLAFPSGAGLLGLMWLGAALGVAKTLLWPHAPKALSAALYVALGWVAVIELPGLHAALGPAISAALVAGGLLYTVGAVCYASRRPNPWPKVFGYHEVFHALTIVAAGCHFWAIAAVALRG